MRFFLLYPINFQARHLITPPLQSFTSEILFSKKVSYNVKRGLQVFCSQQEWVHTLSKVYYSQREYIATFAESICISKFN